VKDDERIFWIRLWLQVCATVATAVAAGAVTFELAGAALNHDLASVSTIIALACNTALTGLASMRHNGHPYPPTARED